jgi:putative ABC transport system ATP-binding protein
MFRLEHLTKQFSDQFVLEDFSFDIQEGEKIIVSGRSGIGKTTLFRLLLGFEQPDSGKIYFENELLTEISVWNLRRRVAYVSQDLNIGRGNLQTFFNETLSLKANAEYKNSSLDELEELLNAFELPDTLLQKNIEELSGGEKQRVAIINALLLKRNIFFLDEITSALDKSLKSKVLDYFLLNPTFTVLSISHDNYLPAEAITRTLKLD